MLNARPKEAIIDGKVKWPNADSTSYRTQTSTWGHLPMGQLQHLTIMMDPRKTRTSSTECAALHATALLPSMPSAALTLRSLKVHASSKPAVGLPSDGGTTRRTFHPPSCITKPPTRAMREPAWFWKAMA